MLNVEHFRELIVRPVLEHLDMHSEAAENLVLGTGIHESALCYLVQLGGGPALGLYQMEPATHDDIRRYINRKPNLVLLESDGTEADEMVWNLKYATCMCRIHYWRRPEPLPDADDADGMGEYWKRWYNSNLGAGTADGFARDYRQYVLA